MRPGGVELLVGVTVDRAFGPVLAVGLGGVWVELLADTSLRVLPVTTDDVKRMLGELRGSPLLHGARGARPADLDVLAQVVKNVGDAALTPSHVLFTNCTTSFYKLPSTQVRWDWRVIANARLDRALYQDGRLDRTLPFKELRRLAYLNDIANTAPATGFGDHIRRELERRRHER